MERSLPTLALYPFGAQAGQRAEAFGLLDYNARYYSPLLQRFISADSLVPNPGAPQALNRYAYAGNNPLRYRDPSGHYACEDAYGYCRPPHRQAPSPPDHQQWWQRLQPEAQNVRLRLEYEAFQAQSMIQKVMDISASAEGPLLTWTPDDKAGVAIPGLGQIPNPHFELREDLELANDVLLLGADITSDAATIFGHGLALAGIASLGFPPPEGEVAAVVEETGAVFFLGLANVIDAATTVDVALTEGPASPQGVMQEGFLFMNWFSGRVTWYLEVPVALSTANFQLVGDVVNLNEKYGNGITFEEWRQMRQDIKTP
jgi:RHS repeat-associated protein